MRLLHGGGGPPLFLIHGLGGSQEDWFGLLPHLARVRTCLVPDLPGFGRSELPDAPYTIPWFRGKLISLAGKLGLEQAAWAGHSMGGHIVLDLALNHPRMVERAALICPAGGHVNPAGLERPLFAALTRPDETLRWGNDSIVRFLIRRCFSFRHRELADQMIERYLVLLGQGDRPARERAFLRAARGVLTRPLWRAAGHLETPVLMYVGGRDHILPWSQSVRLIRNLPRGSEVVVIPRGSHMLPYTHPEELGREMVRFLATGGKSPNL